MGNIVKKVKGAIMNRVIPTKSGGQPFEPYDPSGNFILPPSEGKPKKKNPNKKDYSRIR